MHFPSSRSSNKVAPNPHLHVFNIEGPKFALDTLILFENCGKLENFDDGNHKNMVFHTIGFILNSVIFCLQYEGGLIMICCKSKSSE